MMVTGTKAAPASTPQHAGQAAQPEANKDQYFYSLDPERGVYQFSYDTGPFQHQSFREETRNENGEVQGSYGYVDAGVLRVTEYTAGQSGYRCRQIIRYLVEPDRGIFVRSGKKHLLPATSELHNKSPLTSEWSPKARSYDPGAMMYREDNENGSGDKWMGRLHSPIINSNGNIKGWGAVPKRSAQPARVLGKKVAGHYTDFTSEPAVGGTGLVSPWDSAHKSELHTDEIYGVGQQRMHAEHQQDQRQSAIGGTLVWPVTEDGIRVTWQPF